jgi:hypothetical protein
MSLRRTGATPDLPVRSPTLEVSAYALTTSEVWVGMLQMAARFIRCSPNSVLLLWSRQAVQGGVASLQVTLSGPFVVLVQRPAREPPVQKSM